MEHCTKERRLRRILVVLGALVICVCAVPFRAQVQRPVQTAPTGTVAQRVKQYGPAVRQRLGADFQRIGIPYPPKWMTLVGLKAERVLEVWVAGTDGRPKLLKSYPILGLSGRLGPKLRSGDNQAPEGLYRIESLNPNSRFHLALRVNYPNREDRARGEIDRRTRLGSDIMIHGNTCSAGCLAIGGPASEELFVLAAQTGLDHVSVILSPVDFRVRKLPDRMPPVPRWYPHLCAEIAAKLDKLGR